MPNPMTSMPSEEALYARIRELEEKVRELEVISTHDALTGLLNKRGFDEVAQHHYSILERDICPSNNFSVLFLDIDRFKGINDTYGHPVGDKVIKYLGEVLRSVLRDKHDAVARLGGDEFVILLPGFGVKRAEIVKLKIKEYLSDHPFVDGDIRISLQASVGIAQAWIYKYLIRSIPQILELADEQMYKDKEHNKIQRIPK